MSKSKPLSTTLSKDLNKLVVAEFDVEGKVPITSIQLDGLTLLKIIKHSRENFPNQASGQLLGLDIKEELEVTNCFPFPSLHESTKTSQYRSEMVRHYKDVSIDSNTVGWYVSSQLDEFLTQSFIDTQASYQKNLGHKCVVLVHDASRSMTGNLHIRAYRLSDSFMEVYKTGKFTSTNLKAHKLRFSNILVELPLTVSNSNLASALLQELDDESDILIDPFTAGPSLGFGIPEASSSVFLSPNYSVLDLNTETYIEKNLQTLLDTFEDFNAEQNTLQYHQRAMAREKARIQNYLQTKRAENEARVARGQEELPLETEEQVSLNFKVPPEPSRMDLLFVNHQINACCSQLSQFGGPALTKMYATQALQNPEPQKE